MLKEKIEAIRKDLETGNDAEKLQWFLNFRSKERLAITELEQILQLPKPIVIAVACTFLAGELKNVKAKTNEKI